MNKPTSDDHALLIGLIVGGTHLAGAVVELIDDEDGAHQDTFRATFGGQNYLVSVVPE